MYHVSVLSGGFSAVTLLIIAATINGAMKSVDIRAKGASIMGGSEYFLRRISMPK
jgi:hypothetical protein